MIGRYRGKQTNGIETAIASNLPIPPPAKSMMASAKGTPIASKISIPIAEVPRKKKMPIVLMRRETAA
jgi:hypothetical protein